MPAAAQSCAELPRARGPGEERTGHGDKHQRLAGPALLTEEAGDHVPRFLSVLLLRLRRGAQDRCQRPRERGSGELGPFCPSHRSTAPPPRVAVHSTAAPNVPAGDAFSPGARSTGGRKASAAQSERPRTVPAVSCINASNGWVWAPFAPSVGHCMPSSDRETRSLSHPSCRSITAAGCGAVALCKIRQGLSWQAVDRRWRMGCGAPTPAGRRASRGLPVGRPPSRQAAGQRVQGVRRAPPLPAPQ